MGKPYLAVNHLEGHLLSPFIGAAAGVAPNVALIVSGGHTLLVEVRAVNDYRILGRTVDDAAGEAFDKVAKLLGLGYPGGPEIERRAREGDPTRFDLPRSMLDSGDHNFSFSGLKTAVRYLLPKLSLDEEVVNDVCASFQRAAVEVLVRKTIRAAQDVRRFTGDAEWRGELQRGIARAAGNGLPRGGTRVSRGRAFALDG